MSAISKDQVLHLAKLSYLARWIARPDLLPKQVEHIRQ